MSTKNTYKLCLVIALTLAATSAFATSRTISGTEVIGGGTFSPSNKVTISYEAGPAASNASAYGAKSKHAAGDRVNATNNTDPKMYWSKVDITAVVPAASSTEQYTAAGAWTSM